MAKLTRTAKIGKLGRAIWAYRGQYHKDSGKWVRQPIPSAAARIRKWLDALGVVDVEVALKRIEGLKSYADYSRFLKELES